MFFAEVKTVDKTIRVKKAADDAVFRNLFHAAAKIRKEMAASIQTAPGPSLPGEPPHTHRRALLRRAMRFAVDKKAEDAVIGPRASIVGQVGQRLEFGDEFIDPRPFATPVLLANVPKLADDWAGTIGE